jgi:hypothetical protein
MEMMTGMKMIGKREIGAKAIGVRFLILDNTSVR